MIDVMIPAFDEYQNLVELIPRIKFSLKESNLENVRIHIIHRNDEDIDEMKKLESFGVELIKRFPTNSFGDAIRSGIKAIPADSKLTIFMDADGSHDPKTIYRLVEIMSVSNVDVGIASRYARGGTSDNNLILKAMSRILNVSYGVVLGIRAKDVSTNFKIYRSSQLRKVNLMCHQFDILEELLIRLKLNANNELKIVEVPDHFHNRLHGQSKRKLGPFIAGYILTLFRLRFTSK